MSFQIHCSLFSSQSTAVAFDEVDEQSVYLCTGQPLPADIANIVEWMLNEDFSTAYESNAGISNTVGWYQMRHIVSFVPWLFRDHPQRSLGTCMLLAVLYAVCQ